jgi:hypothetical protein
MAEIIVTYTIDIEYEGETSEEEFKNWINDNIYQSINLGIGLGDIQELQLDGECVEV